MDCGGCDSPIHLFTLADIYVNMEVLCNLISSPLALPQNAFSSVEQAALIHVMTDNIEHMIARHYVMHHERKRNTV